MGDAAFDTDPHGFDRLFRSGLDTAEIASRTGCAEAYVANSLHRLREARMAPDPPAAAADAPRPRKTTPKHDVPDHLKSLYALARRKGFAPPEALAFAERNKGGVA